MANFEAQSNPDVRAGAVDQVLSQRREQQEQAEREYNEAKERYQALIELVTQRYLSPESTLAGSPEQQESFIKHNDELLRCCIERGYEKGLSEQELQILEVAGILHDLNKADRAPAAAADVPNYVLAAHNQLAAGEVPAIIKKNPEVLSGILGADYSQEQADAVIVQIQTAIRSHMGPHPGFMTGILAGVNKKLVEKNLPPLEHPFPKAGDKISETLLAADMYSLAGVEGRKKVLAIRANVPFFQQQDQQQAATINAVFAKRGIDMVFAAGEAALLSGFASAKQAQDMLPDSSDKAWVGQTISDSKLAVYSFHDKTSGQDQPVDFIQAERKMNKYLELLEQEKIQAA